VNIAIISRKIKPNWHPNEAGTKELSEIAEKIKQEGKRKGKGKGKGKDFDCIIGLSGGLDSSYTAYVAKEIMGLRPLLFSCGCRLEY
jgi:NH3-dependent NAD+ synthetase